MTKDEFNKLSIEEQVEHINIQLHLVSLNRIAKSIGMSESTIRDRFKGKGYTRVGNQYVYSDKAITTDITTVTTQANKKDSKSNKDTIDINTLLKRIEVLEKQMNDINNKISTTDITTVTTSNIKKYKGNAVARNYRVDEEIQKEFKLYCKKHKEHRVSDILSHAIEEYINKYK